jgi:hypothetical protein
MTSTLSGTFSYVLIPADEESELQRKEGDKSGGLADDALVKSAKEYFFQQSGGDAKREALKKATDEEKAALAQKVRDQVVAANPNASEQISKMSTDALIDLVRSTEASPSCEIIALTVPTKGNQYRAVSMYLGDGARDQGRPLNTRASALLTACGHALPATDDSTQPPGIYGDVFVGRCHDNEASDVWQRVDFDVNDADPSADWCVVARSHGGGGGSGNTAASLSGSLSQTLTGGGQPLQIGGDSGSASSNIWSQTDEEVELKFSVAAGTKAKYCKVTFGRESLKVAVAGQTLVNGKTGGRVAVEDSTYTIQDESGKRELTITLGKKDAGVMWPYAVKSK